MGRDEVCAGCIMRPGEECGEFIYAYCVEQANRAHAEYELEAYRPDIASELKPVDAPKAYSNNVDKRVERAELRRDVEAYAQGFDHAMDMASKQAMTPALIVFIAIAYGIVAVAMVCAIVSAI